MPSLVSQADDTEGTEISECSNELSLCIEANDNEEKSDNLSEDTAVNSVTTVDNSTDLKEESVTPSNEVTSLKEEDHIEDEPNEDYEQLRINNIKEKEKFLSQVFKGVNVEEIKETFARSPKRKRFERKKKSPKILVLPRKHLPRRNASKAASERVAIECSVDDDEVADLSDEEEIMENGRKRKVIVAFRPRARHYTTAHTEPRIILSVDEITEEHLKKVADIVTEKVYTQSGTTCHQCRQKTNDMKTICRSDKCTGVRGYFCGPCLRNRYGEDARAALKDPEWKCPPCRGVCNCSICRNRAGAHATGILTPIAKRCGYASVKDYLNDHDKFVIKYEDE